MNRRERDVLLALAEKSYTGQRELADACGCSLGAVNGAVQNLLKEGYLDEAMSFTEKTNHLLHTNTPQRAVLLAAGFGLRMMPMGAEIPKALLEVNGQRLIDRIIGQLHSVGIREIYVVVGYAKEKFEYLIDQFGVELIVNPDYAAKNNLHSLFLAREHLRNCYVVPCDMWCRINPFRKRELYSWYMVSDAVSMNSAVRVNRKNELAVIAELSSGNEMIGISYILAEDGEKLRDKLCRMDPDRRYKGAFWEETLYEDDKLWIGPRVVAAEQIVEVNTYEQLLDLDKDSASLRVAPAGEIAQLMGVRDEDIRDVTMLKKGMTNRSFSFRCGAERYILRIPGDETKGLIHRAQEAAVYRTLSGRGMADDVVYFNPDTGYKIAKYLEPVHSCDPHSEADLKSCMNWLRSFHDSALAVDHTVDLFSRIEFYESLWGGNPSVYGDYKKTKEQVFSLRSYIDSQKKSWCLTHLDAVADNFLIDESGEIRLIDWEYAAMQDPHVDIAMFCLYALYRKEQVDHLIDLYFPEGCPKAVRLKIYCYMAVGGLMWSNWCEYKSNSGIEFGEYSLRQYRYAKEYYRIVRNELSK